MRAASLIAELALVVCGSGCTAQAQSRPPVWQCNVEVREGNQWWQVDRTSARWTFFTEDRAMLTLSAFTYDRHTKHHVITDGAFSEWASAYLVVSPRTMRAKGKLWASIATEGKALPGQRVAVSRGFYSATSFKVYDLMPYLAEGETLTVRFYDKKAQELDRILVPVATLSSAAARLVPLITEYDRRVAAPSEEVCEDVNPDNMIIFAP
jgi:hypothetical protein